MKKLLLPAMVAASLLISCTSEDSDESANGGFSNDPVSGVVYDEAFTFGGGKASPITVNGVESLYIYLGESALNCESSTSACPIWIVVPEAVGSYTPQTDGHLQFEDNADGGFEGSLDAEIEITSITATTVTGKVKATGFYDDENSINGTFTVPYCGLD